MSHLIVCTILFLLPALLSAHLCISWPNQRGGWNPGNTEPGDSLCFQPTAPCGTKTPSTPQIVLPSGTTFYVQFQQNLNHYNPGYPGFLDISYAVGSTPPNQDSFILLEEVPDRWTHLQAAQTNFSVPILIPNMDCIWCTLQVRYHPNKPTEPIFHNCADVAFQKSTNVPTQRFFGFVNQKDGGDGYLSRFVEILNDGQLQETALVIPLFKRQIITNQFLSNGVITYWPASRTIYFIGDSLGAFVNAVAPSTLYSYSIDTDTFTPVTRLTKSGVQWNALLSGTMGLYGVQTAFVSSGIFSFTVSSISLDGTVKDIATTKSTDTFVNFFWADIDNINGYVYILSGDENSLTELDALLYTINLKDGSVTQVAVNNSVFTLSNLHVHPQTGVIYSVSPGLFNNLNWSIVRINPMTGAVSLVSSIANSFLWPRNYGGGIYNGIVAAQNQILHTFKWQSTGATALTVLDINTGKTTYITDIDLGINNHLILNSVIAIT
jgi:hypothetical protein